MTDFVTDVATELRDALDRRAEEDLDFGRLLVCIRLAPTVEEAKRIGAQWLAGRTGGALGLGGALRRASDTASEVTTPQGWGVEATYPGSRTSEAA